MCCPLFRYEGLSRDTLQGDSHHSHVTTQVRAEGSNVQGTSDISSPSTADTAGISSGRKASIVIFMPLPLLYGISGAVMIVENMLASCQNKVVVQLLID